MKIIKKELVESEKEIGYECDVCHKRIIYKDDFLPQKNTITWSYPEGKEIIDFCSMECLLRALKNVYFGADIKLSYDFLASFRKVK